MKKENKQIASKLTCIVMALSELFVRKKPKNQRFLKKNNGQLSVFLETSNSLFQHQYALRVNSSTELAVLDIYHYITQNIESNSTSLLEFL